MLNKVLLLVATSFISHIAYAENCPTVGMIKHNLLHHWQAYDSEDNKPLSPKRLAQFKQNIEQFTLAEWQANDKSHNSMHCYYRDKNGSQLEAYLTKNDLMPMDNKKFWYQVSGSMQCAAGMNQCVFQRRILNQPQLARK